jgi:predicted RNase H-like nuclease (RuvC/YqgF family)
LYPILLNKEKIMRHIRRVQSESSLERQPTLEAHTKDWIQKQSKQHQAQPPHPTSNAPTKLECCEKLANQNNELQKILHEQEKQIESLQDTIRNLIDENKSLMSKLGDRMKEFASLRLKAASLNHDLETALNDKRMMSHTINELQGKFSELNLLPRATPRAIIVIKMLEILNKASQPLSGKGLCISLVSLDSRTGTNLSNSKVTDIRDSVLLIFV